MRFISFDRLTVWTRDTLEFRIAGDVVDNV
jgi:hypothetical protein